MITFMEDSLLSRAESPQHHFCQAPSEPFPYGWDREPTWQREAHLEISIADLPVEHTPLNGFPLLVRQVAQ